jgi:hypothetical protein
MRKKLARHIGIFRKGLTAANVNKLLGVIDYKNAANVRHHMGKAFQWLKTQVGGRRYAYFLPNAIENLNNANNYIVDDFKSYHWVAHKVFETIGRWPTAVVTNYGNAFQRLIEHGVKDFVMADDAAYSGSQIVNHIQRFTKIISSLKQAGIKLHVALGYASPRAMDIISQVANEAQKNRVHVNFYASGKLPSLHQAIAHLSKNNQNKLLEFFKHGERTIYYPPTISILAHKLPDYASIPKEIMNAFGGVNKHIIPPYRQVKTRKANYSVQSIVVNGNMRTYTYGNGRKATFQNVGGILVPVNDVEQKGKKRKR